MAGANGVLPLGSHLSLFVFHITWGGSSINFDKIWGEKGGPREILKKYAKAEEGLGGGALRQA